MPKFDGEDYSDTDVRAYLRAAVSEDILWGWNNAMNGFVWTVSPPKPGKTKVMNPREVREYCYMLNLYGVVPLYIK